MDQILFPFGVQIEEVLQCLNFKQRTEFEYYYTPYIYFSICSSRVWENWQSIIFREIIKIVSVNRD